MKEHLLELAAILKECGEPTAADVSAAAAGTEEEMRAFLTSNDLWGGAGSIADSAGAGGARDGKKRRIEAALVKLGTEQMKVGLVNVRTANWVSAFKGWSERGI